ncbi:MAG TPA: hypothetical protein VNL17_07590 [Verrucomicrobiae bacterium]|nr:hypothetical protein [Verrucomicrobiae bacterium]
MKLTALILCSVPALIILSSGPVTEAVSSEKALRKAAYAPYTGQQRDWPRSDKHVTPTEIGRGGVPIYDQLPDRPYEVLGTVSASGDLAVKHASLAAAAAGANAILITGDKAFTDAGIDIQPRWLKDKRMPDPHAPPPSDHRLDHPDQIRSADSPPTIIVNELTGILIRWKLH